MFVSRLRFILHCLVLAVCLYACAFAGYPPAKAQEITTAKDAVQDEQISTLKDRFRAIDEHLSHSDATIVKLSEDLSGIRGEFRTVGGLVGLLQIAGMVLSGKRAKSIVG